MYNLWQLMWAIPLGFSADSHENSTHLQQVADPPGPD